MSKQKIFLLDVEATDAAMLTEWLQTEYEYEVVRSGEKDFSYFMDSIGTIDLIITDLKLARQTGCLVLKWIEAEPKHKYIPLLTLISLEQPDDIKGAFEIGSDDIIAKPLNLEIVKKRIGNMMCVGGNRRMHNVMEDLLQAEIDEYISDLGMCTCAICRRDLLTLTLNHIEPKYVTSERGAAISKAERTASREEKLKLLTQIAYCAQMVKKKPNHG